MYRAEFAIDRLEIAGVPLDFLLQSQIPAIIQGWRDAGHRASIVVSNPHAIMLCHRDPDMHRAIALADLNLPDGVGVILACELLGYGRRHRVTGPALMLEVCNQGRAMGFRHFFHGGGEGIADRLAECLSNRFPGLQVAGTCCPPFRDLSPAEDAAIVAQINATKPDIVWVGLGAPKQEKWMAAHADRIEATTMIGVGAAFDFHSGNVAWAPRWVRRTGMEWAWRLALDPKRMWRRNLDSPLFLLHVLAQMLHRHGSQLPNRRHRHAQLPPQADTVYTLPIAGHTSQTQYPRFGNQPEIASKRKAG